MGKNRADKIMAIGGQDKVTARGGNDKVWAGNGHDTVSGDDGDDWITLAARQRLGLGRARQRLHRRRSGR